MIVDVTIIPEEIPAKSRINESTWHLVVDILRATSTITTLIEGGIQWVRPFLHFEQAFESYSREVDPDILLIGEREGKKIPSFHFGNSPRDLWENRSRIHGKKAYLSTTNGTRVLDKIKKYEKIIVGSFLNLDAVLEYLVKQNPEMVVIHCAGSSGQISLEDTFFAGFFIRRWQERSENLKLYDGAVLALALYQQQIHHQNGNDEEQILGVLKTSAHGKYLLKLGFEADLEFCSRLNVFQSVPVWDARIKGLKNGGWV